MQRKLLRRVPALAVLNDEAFLSVINVVEDIVDQAGRRASNISTPIVQKPVIQKHVSYADWTKHVRSMTDRTKLYAIQFGEMKYSEWYPKWNSPTNYTCSCPAFQYSNTYKHCKHIMQLRNEEEHVMGWPTISRRIKNHWD